MVSTGKVDDDERSSCPPLHVGCGKTRGRVMLGAISFLTMYPGISPWLLCLSPWLVHPFSPPYNDLPVSLTTQKYPLVTGLSGLLLLNLPCHFYPHTPFNGMLFGDRGCMEECLDIPHIADSTEQYNSPLVQCIATMEPLNVDSLKCKHLHLL